MTLIRFMPSRARPLSAAAVAALVVGCGSVSELEPDAEGGNGQDPDAAATGADASTGAADALTDADQGVAFPDDPVLFLPFRDSSFQDQSGQGQNMSSSLGDPQFVADRFGFAERALDLTENQNSDFDLALASEPLGLSGEISMAVWIRTFTASGETRIIGQGEWFTLSFASSSVQFGLVDAAEPIEPSVVSSSSHDHEVWALYVGVVEIDGGETTLKLFRDGTLVASETFTGTFPPPDQCQFYVGNFEQGNGCTSLDRPRRLDAYVDDLRVYDRALSVEEIELLYAEGGWPPS
jgi:hypothetical protein